MAIESTGWVNLCSKRTVPAASTWTSASEPTPRSARKTKVLLGAGRRVIIFWYCFLSCTEYSSVSIAYLDSPYML